MANSVQIRFQSDGKSSFEIYKGELLYLQHTKDTKSYIDSLIGIAQKDELIVTLQDTTISSLDRSSLANHRKSIAFVSDDLTLVDSETVEESISSYLASINSISDKSQIDFLLSKFGISRSTRNSSLSDLDQFLVKVVIGLAKKPAIIILENPLTQISDSEYSKVMDSIYDLILEQSITCIVTLSNLALVDYYPGRIVSPV